MEMNVFIHDLFDFRKYVNFLALKHWIEKTLCNIIHYLLQLLENEESSSLKFPLTTVQIQIQNIYNGKWFWNYEAWVNF